MHVIVSALNKSATQQNFQIHYSLLKASDSINKKLLKKKKFSS